MDWKDYEKWCINNKSKRYAKFLVRYGKKWSSFAFSYDLVEYPNNRTKEDILKTITNLTRYLDIKYDSNFHEEFLYWIKRKEIRWKAPISMRIPNEIPLEEILENIKRLPEKYRLFATFSLVSGLRTFETVRVLNNHSALCKDGIIEMYWDRKTKKANAVYCHPLLHDKIKFTYSENSIHRHLTTKMLGCQIKYLRKINFTKIATEIDPMLAEFMQGRRGSVSQRHYFLPLLGNNKIKWMKIWEDYINEIINH
jgi:intergrase/recombinase